MALASGDIIVYDGSSWVNTGYSQINCAGNLGVGVGTTIQAALHLKAGAAAVNGAPLKFTSGTNLTTPEQGATEFDGFRLLHTPVSTRRAVALSSDHMTATTTIANSTVEQTAFTGTIAANEMAVGKTFSARMLGRYSTANATDTFTLRCKIGGTTVFTFTSTAKSVTDTPLELEFIFTCRSTGTTGTVRAQAPASFDHVDVGKVATGDTTVNTTAALNVTITVQWSAAVAGNSMSVAQGFLAVLN